MPLDVPAIGVSFSHALDDHRSIVFQAHIPRDCSDEDLNGLLDRITKASDRAKAKTAVPTYRGILETQKRELEKKTNELLLLQAERQVVSERWAQTNAASGRRAPKPGPQERQDHITIQGKIAQCERDIADLRKQINSYEDLVGQYEAKLGG